MIMWVRDEIFGLLTLAKAKNWHKRSSGLQNCLDESLSLLNHNFVLAWSRIERLLGSSD
jgi:hypothetical protein